MRPPLTNPKMTQPFVVVFITQSSSVVPSVALTNYGMGTLDADTVQFAGVRIPLVAKVNGVNISEMKPSSLGMGLHRREATFDIVNGDPFSIAPFSNMLYAAGATVDDFYFSIWVTDFSVSHLDITDTGTFYGHFKLDSGLGWSESNGTTNVKLVDMLTQLNGRYNSNTATAEQLLAGSEWQPLLEAPAYLGWKPKVKAIGRVLSGIGGFDSYYKSVKGVISGVVQSSTLSGTSIILGKSPVLASIVGASTKLKMGNGCIITGVITDLGSGDYGINTTGLVLNDKWDSILVYNKGFTAAGTAVGSGAGVNNTNLQSIFLDETVPLTRVPSPTMYLRSQGTVEFYNGGPVTSTGPMFVKLTGITDEANKELSSEEFKDPLNSATKFTGVNVDFFTTQQSFNFSETALLHLNYAKWLAPQTYDLYFSNKTFVLADIQKSGMPWELIITPHVNTSVVLDHVYYIRLIPNNIIGNAASGQYAIYADNSKSLIPIASADITSIAYNQTDFGMVDLCKITLARRLKDIDEAFDENVLYVDTGPTIHASQVISYIMDKAGIPKDIRGTTLCDGLLGNPLSLSITDETWTDLLDSVVFESGLQIDTINGMYEARSSFKKAIPYTWNRAGGTQKFLRIGTEAQIPFSDVIDNSYKLDIGRTLTSIDAQRREFVRAHYSYKFLYSNYKGTKYHTLESVKVAKDNDRIIDFTFKHITDSDTATACAKQISVLGHVANVGETTRVVNIALPMKYMQLQVMDAVTLQDFRHINAVGSPLTAYDAASANNPYYTVGQYGPYVRYDDTTPYMLIPGVGVITKIDYNFSGDGPPIVVEFKQVQFGTTSNLRDIADNIDLNTEAENNTDGANSDNNSSPNYPSGSYRCPDGSHIANIIISPGDFIPGTSTTAGCCGESSTEADTYGEQKVTVICVGDGGNIDDPWPDGCYDDPRIWWEAVTDTEIGNTEPLVYKLFCSATATPGLVSLSYPGQGTPDSCVAYLPRDLSGGWNAWFATLSILPCVFSKPENMYGKAIQLVFNVTICIYKEKYWDEVALKYKRGRTYKTVTQYIAPPVTLRPTSDISMG